MKSLPLLLFIIFVAASNEITNSWKISVTDEAGNSNIKISKGQYKKLQFQVTRLNTGLIPNAEMRFVLKNESQNIFSLLDQKVLVKPRESLLYTIYLGIKCGQDVSLQTTFTLDWKIDQISLDTITFEKTTIILDPTPVNIELQSISSSVPMNSRGFFKLQNEIYNIENIDITVNALGYKVETVTLDQYSININRKLSKLSYQTGAVDADVQTEFEFKLKEANSCFSIDNTKAVITVKKVDPIIITEEMKGIMVNNIMIKVPKVNNSIVFSTKIPVAPVLLSCMATTTGKEFKDDEIREQTRNPNNKQFYTQYYIDMPIDSMDVVFTGLDRIGEYRIKCLVDNTSINFKEEDSQGFIIGWLKESDVKQHLSAFFNNVDPAQCATWTFAKDVAIKDFEEKAENYCNELFQTDNLIGAFLNGCMSCSKRTVESRQASICVSSSPICLTSFKSDSQRQFQKFFAGSINDATTIKEKFGLSDYPVESVAIHVDDGSPNKTLIKGNVIEVDQSKSIVKINVISTNSQPIVCSYNKISRESLKWMFPDEVKASQIILKPNQNQEISVGFVLLKENEPYNLVFNCKNLPNYSGAYYQTGPFPVASFIYSKVVVEDDKPVEKKDCKKFPFAIECLKRAKKFITDLVTKFPMEDNEDEVETFSRLSNIHQKIMLKIETEALKTIKNFKDKLNKVIKLAEFISQRQCNAFDNYEECRKSKKEIHAELIKFLKEKFPSSCSDFMTQLEKFGLNDLEENIKMVLVLLQSLTNSPDALNSKEDSTIISDFAFCVSDSFEKVWEKLEPVLKNKKDKVIAIKKDIVGLLTKVTANFMEIIQYDEIDKYLDGTIVEKTKLLVSEKAKKIKEHIEKAINRLIQFGESKFQYAETMTVQVIEKVQSVLSQIDFENLGLHVKVSIKHLLEKYKADKILFYIYEKYPLLSVENNSVNPKVIAIKLLDKLGELIPVDSIESEFLPEILFVKQALNGEYKGCYYYDEKTNEFSTKGMDYKTIIIEEIEYISCKVRHFTDFTVGDLNNGLAWWAILLIVLGAMLVIGGIVIGYILYKKKSTNDSDLSLENNTKEYRLTDDKF